MRMQRRTQRLTAWIACFAILLLLFAPAVSHALQAGAAGHVKPLAQICSTAPPASKAAASAAPPAQEQAMHVPHCPFCSAHAAAPDCLPAAAFVLPHAGSPPLAAAGTSRIARAPLLWVRAQSRAPPAI